MKRDLARLSRISTEGIPGLMLNSTSQELQRKGEAEGGGLRPTWQEDGNKRGWMHIRDMRRPHRPPRLVNKNAAQSFLAFSANRGPHRAPGLSKNGS